MKSLLSVLLLIFHAAASALAQAPVTADPDLLQAEIAALRPEQPQRAEVPWRFCLLEACRDARAKNKPVLIWAYRGDPAEGRC